MVQRCRKVIGGICILFIALLARSPSDAQQAVDNSFVITNVRLFDGERVLDDVQVAVVDGRIREVGDDLRQWQTLRIIDGANATLLPGFIDAHVHVRDADDLRQALQFGVTTVLDMGAVIPLTDLFALRDRANTSTDMADLRSAGFFAGAPRGDMAADARISVVVPTVSSVEEAEAFPSQRRAEGSDYLKLGLRGVRSASTGTSNLDEPRARALVSAAHDNDMLAIAHIETLDDVNIALRANIDGLAHVWRRGGANAEIARRIVDERVFVVAALAIPDGFMPDGRMSLLADPRFSSAISGRIETHLGRSFGSLTPGLEPRVNLEGQIAAARSLHDAGARLLVGTDANRDNPAAFGISVHREFQLLQEAGLSAVEVLIAAAASAADSFRLDDRGRLVPGRRADMLLVRGDPTSDILATRDILRVWKSGVEVDRTAVER